MLGYSRYQFIVPIPAVIITTTTVTVATIIARIGIIIDITAMVTPQLLYVQYQPGPVHDALGI